MLFLDTKIIWIAKSLKPQWNKSFSGWYWKDWRTEKKCKLLIRFDKLTSFHFIHIRVMLSEMLRLNADWITKSVVRDCYSWILHVRVCRDFNHCLYVTPGNDHTLRLLSCASFENSYCNIDTHFFFSIS